VHETDAILDAWRGCRRRGQPAVLATVVKVTGSAYRRPGARMIFPVGAAPAGVVSGGCLEGDLAERIGTVLDSGEPRIQVYDMRSPDDIVWGLGLGCNGEIRVLLEKLDPASGVALPSFLAECREQRRPGVIATVFEVDGPAPPAVGERLMLRDDGTAVGDLSAPGFGPAVLKDAKECLRIGRSRVWVFEMEGSRAEALIEYLPPAVSLLVFGAGSDARPLVRIAKELGWEVTVMDNRAGHARPERFPEADSVRVIDFDKLGGAGLRLDGRTPAVVMTHHFLHDQEILAWLLPRSVCYLGLLGPRKRTENLLREIGSKGVKPAEETSLRLHGPVGLDIGAETPEEIALAVVAEIQAALSERSGGFLKDRTAPLHDWPE
jgi:xanthine/CO dehydrogenase XdhC/CoxF family maturation factor